MKSKKGEKGLGKWLMEMAAKAKPQKPAPVPAGVVVAGSVCWSTTSEAAEYLRNSGGYPIDPRAMEYLIAERSPLLGSDPDKVIAMWREIHPQA